MGRGDGVEVRPNSIRLFFVWRDERYHETLTVGGKPVKPTAANLNYARRQAAEIRKRIALGNFNLAEFFPDSKRAEESTATPATFGSLADMWLAAQGNKSDHTKYQYSTYVRFWKKLVGEHATVRDITHAALAAKIGQHPWGTAQHHNNYLIALRGIFGLHYRGRTAGDDPCIGIKNMRRRKKLPDPFTAAERDAILEDMRTHYDPRVYAYFLFAFYTGMRPEELIALRWSDVDMRRAMIRVQRVRTFKGTERDGTKTDVERDVDLVPPALHALKLMQPYTRLLGLDAEIFQNPRLSLDVRSGQMRKYEPTPWHDERSQRDQYWKPTLVRLKIRYRTSYKTRHTYASLAYMGGLKPAYIASQLGNNVKVLLEAYATYMPNGNDGTDKQALDKLFSADWAQSSPEVPQASRDESKLLIPKGKTGRREWTRTKDSGST